MNISDLSVGDALPTLRLPIDRTLIVAGAIASQDFEDVHHDPDAAVRRGTPDIFISINTTNGLIDRYVTDWSGPNARLASVSLRLGMPLHPGDTLTFDATVEVVEQGQVTLKVAGRHERGVHVTARVRIDELQEEHA